MNPPVATKIRLHWEDFPTGRVMEFGSMAVTREEVLAFATRYDPQPFHVDDAAAEASMFGRLAASGWQTCSMAMRMMCDAFLLESSSMGSPGLDQLRWLKPVYPGDTLRVRITVLNSRPMASRRTAGLTQFGWEILNQADEVVLTMQGWNIFGRREAAPG